jgi:drug/metabolite transporter (DMT)-like permease
MSSGLLPCFLGALCFGLMGCASKFAERRNCQASVLVVLLFTWATLVMLLRSAGLHSMFSLPHRAIAVAVVCGICAAGAYYAFQSSIGMGKLSVAWLMMNISSAIPAVVSIFEYGESISRLKILALALVLVSLLLIFRGRQMEMQADADRPRGHTRWFLLMVVILITNGMSAFGLKVIAGWGLPESAKFPYLTVWYAAGLLIVAAPIVVRGVHIRLREVGWSAVVAGLSIGGQIAMAIALKLSVPGHVVFPIAMGGAVFIVILGGRVLFGERMSGITASGVSFGLSAVILLSLS